MIAFPRITAFADGSKIGGPVRTVTGDRHHMIERISGYSAYPTPAAIVGPSRRNLVYRRRAGCSSESRLSGKMLFALTLATSLRLRISAAFSKKLLPVFQVICFTILPPSINTFLFGLFGVRNKPFRVLSVECRHKTATRCAALVAAATIVHIAAIRAVRHFTIATTFVDFLSSSRGVFSSVPCLPAENAFPVAPILAISFQPEFRNWLRGFARCANLQFWNRQGSSILPLSTHKEVQFV
jgi:hypothetical protein